MKKSKIIIPIIAIIGIILAAVLIIVLLPKNAEEKISDFVIENQIDLEAIALEQLDGNNDTNSYKQAKVDGVFNSIVQFSYSSFGITPAFKYCGFYYSQDGNPSAFQGVEVSLEQVSNNEWKWSDGTDNGGLTKKITDNWFYYEAWF